jgi:hypothetical protein
VGSLHCIATEELRDLGFRLAGRFVGGHFELDPEWRGRQGVYVWIADDGPMRVGVACGPDGFRSRYRLYNSWLNGRFKPNHAEEQQKRALFQARLDEACQIWARDAADKAAALELERFLRARWGAVLSLDLMAKGSWAQLQMKKWRAERGTKLAIDPRKAKGSPVPLLEPRGPPRHRAIGPVHARLERMLILLGLTPMHGDLGTSYKLGRRTLCRIDPKRSYLRVEVGLPAEASAPPQLQTFGKRRGWLIVRDEWADLAEEYILECARRKLDEQGTS